MEFHQTIKYTVIEDNGRNCFIFMHSRSDKLFCNLTCKFCYLLLESTDPTSLQCSTCNAEFSSAWALVQHCHQEHKMTIYKTVCEIVNI